MSITLKNKKIPAIAITSLVVGGACGEEGGGGGGGGGNSPAAIAQDFCSSMQTCYADFDYYYDSVAACAADLETDLAADQAEITAEYGATCANAYMAAMACIADAMDVCDYYAAYDACEAEGQAMADVCDFEYYSSSYSSSYSSY